MNKFLSLHPEIGWGKMNKFLSLHPEIGWGKMNKFLSLHPEIGWGKMNKFLSLHPEIGWGKMNKFLSLHPEIGWGKMNMFLSFSYFCFLLKKTSPCFFSISPNSIYNDACAKINTTFSLRTLTDWAHHEHSLIFQRR